MSAGADTSSRSHRTLTKRVEEVAVNTELFVSVLIGGETHTTKNPIKEALLIRVQQLDRLLEWAINTIVNPEDPQLVADMLMKMSTMSNRAGYRLLGSELVSLATSDGLDELCQTYEWPEAVECLLGMVLVRREACLAAALKIGG